MNKVIVVLICLLAIPCQARIIYVNDGANRLNDGSSWENAYKFLQDAMEDANSSPKPVEIRVAQGIYRPDENTLHPNGTGDRTATFQLINGVTLKGGYAGFGEPDPNAQDIRLYETILSGDLDSNDIEFEGIESSDFIYSPSRSENSYTVVTGSGTDSRTVLDGFTITGGNSNGQYGPEGNGGGMYNHCGNPTVVNCIFRKNSTRGRDCCFPYIGAGGGGVFNLQSSPTFRNCRFEENLAYGADEFSCGGGIYDVNSQPTLIRCTFARNIVYGYDSEYYGGAIFDYNSSTVLTDCSFIDNWSHSGGALYSTQNSSATMRGCLFVGNYAYHGGGAILSSSAHLNLASCTFAGNRAPYSATIDCEHWEKTNYLKAVNSILWDGGGEVSALLSEVQITFSDIQGGWEGKGNINVDPCFAQPGHWDDNGTPDTDHDDFWINGDYHLLQCSPCINAGDPNYIAEPNETDLDGRPRVIGGRIDMGTYEFRLPRTLYVDDDATGANNGSSWVDAYKYLQDALAVAKSGDEIRVAQGIYKPDEDSNHPAGTGDREATFQLKNGVTIRGGYAGVGQPDPNVRHILLYKTVLSGDLDGSMGELTKETFFDVMVPRYSSTTASYHVVLADRTDSSSVLDGLTITGGVANGSDFDPVMDITTYDGGGIYCKLASPTLIDCTIRGNCVVFHAGGPAPSGGGMYNQQGNPMLIRCTFELNAADDYDGDSWAAGLMNYLGTVRLTDCVFADNRTVQWGGGLANKGDATLERCRFVGNFARIYGGAIYNEEGLLTLKNCLLEQNSSGWYPGGGIINFGCCEVTNCTFVRNSNYALVHSGEGAMVCNSIFCDGGKEITGLYEPIEVEVAYSDVQGGWPGQGNIDVDPCFADVNNGDYHLKSQAGRWDANEGQWTKDDVTSPCIDAGDPNTPIGLEPFPNGGIINMGAYGSTREASKSYFGEPACETIVAGDINGDCKVDFKDFSVMAFHWLEEH